MFSETRQKDLNGNWVDQIQSGQEGAADVNIASGAVAIDQTSSGDTNAVALVPSNSMYSRVSNISTPIYATSLIIKAGAGKLYGISGYNSKGSAQWIQLHDSATLPADAAVPKVTITVAATANFSIDFGTLGRYFASGIVVCNSSTGPTKTIGSADIFVDAQYV